MRNYKVFIPLVALGFIFIFFKAFLLQGFLPIPSDTIVGLYHPFRDLYSDTNPNGLPYKNFLITDPVRQIIPWKYFSVEKISEFSLPVWNPYEMAGKPNIGNFQSSVFYPLNALLFISPFAISWSVFILLQQVLGALFMYLYLRSLRLNPLASLFGSTSFVFSGFFIAWLEWGTIGHTALWLPLILLSIDTFISSKNQKKEVLWGGLLTFSLAVSFFAGHLQTFFYMFGVSILYLVVKIIMAKITLRKLAVLLGIVTIFLVVTSVQWVPTLQFILLSARSLDQSVWDVEGWFLPWQHLVQFLIPDFFGNPATLNYWGTWNYGELVGYVGIPVLFFVLFAVINRRDKKVWFFSFLALVSLLLAMSNFVSKLPFVLGIPFISTAQPTRLLFVVTFSLSVLGALGLDYYMASKRNSLLRTFAPFFILVIVLGGIVGLVYSNAFPISPENLAVTKRNSIVPVLIIVVFAALWIPSVFLNKKLKTLFVLGIILIAFVDLLRFGQKFTPFTSPEYFFLSSKIITYLQRDPEVFRIATTDSRIFPPNFPTYYGIQSIEGYDPLYLRSYAELIAASERGEPDIEPPFGFNRIITPRNLESPIVNFLGVKYILTLDRLDSPRYTLVIEEGQTKLYRNNEYYNRAFFVEKIEFAESDQQAIERMMNSDLQKVAILSTQEMSQVDPDTLGLQVGTVRIVQYSSDKIVLQTSNSGRGFLVLSDNYYPTWKATVDGEDVEILKTNHTFRGLLLSEGDHEIVLYSTLFSF